MSATIPYPAFSATNAAALAFEPERRAGLRGGTAFGGLSPSDVPTSLDVELRGDDYAVIWLGYANDEPGETALRVANAAGTTHVRLAVHSRKLLEVHLKDVRKALERPGSAIEPEFMSEWISGLPVRLTKSCVRNVLLVSALLDAMPEETRREIRRVLNEQKR